MRQPFQHAIRHLCFGAEDIRPIVGNGLQLGKRIADELAEAKRLRQDAERLLKEYEAKRAAAEREAADIVVAAAG